MTTSETIDEVDNIYIINDELKSKLLQVLSLADFVKFAKAQPLPDEHDLSFKNALSFVEETKKLILNSVSETTKKEVNNDNKKI